ncbi:hypothetical protein VJY32_08500 [Ignavibacteria bacterium 4148-Me]|uniref:hypothetical protein n=1 Tax=Rosettibacter primus TaxID=3111523 RepID=UPI00336C1604
MKIEKYSFIYEEVKKVLFPVPDLDYGIIQSKVKERFESNPNLDYNVIFAKEIQKNLSNVDKLQFAFIYLFEKYFPKNKFLETFDKYFEKFLKAFDIKITEENKKYILPENDLAYTKTSSEGYELLIIDYQYSLAYRMLYEILSKIITSLKAKISYDKLLFNAENQNINIEFNYNIFQQSVSIERCEQKIKQVLNIHYIEHYIIANNLKKANEILKKEDEIKKKELQRKENDFISLSREHSIALEKLKKKRKAETHKEFPINILTNIKPEIINKIKSVAKECIKKNGKINYSKMGKQLGVSNHTARNWCKKLNIEDRLLN